MPKPKQPDSKKHSSFDDHLQNLPDSPIADDLTSLDPDQEGNKIICEFIETPQPPVFDEKSIESSEEPPIIHSESIESFYNSIESGGERGFFGQTTNELSYEPTPELGEEKPKAGKIKRGKKTLKRNENKDELKRKEQEVFEIMTRDIKKMKSEKEKLPQYYKQTDKDREVVEIMRSEKHSRIRKSQPRVFERILEREKNSSELGTQKRSQNPHDEGQNQSRKQKK